MRGSSLFPVAVAELGAAPLWGLAFKHAIRLSLADKLQFGLSAGMSVLLVLFLPEFNDVLVGGLLGWHHHILVNSFRLGYQTILNPSFKGLRDLWLPGFLGGKLGWCPIIAEEYQPQRSQSTQRPLIKVFGYLLNNSG